MKITSRAQLAMFQRAADDAAYAAERGFTQDLAREHLKAHEAAGSPDLPERLDHGGGRRASKTEAMKRGANDRSLFLSSMKN
ncbi:MAG TPA: hypothetical protein VEU47_13500 [Candidatus Cybelea sp.]|nr:hypothetical protein [Candidatus Cybelea sp.]